jgi:hypothetical protein
VIAGTSTYFQAGNTTTTYDADANIVKVVDQFATNKTRTFVTDLAGHILQKTENGQTQNFFYANDNPVGSSGIVNSSGAVILNPDFDYNYTPVNDKYPGNAPGQYVVSQGDTLASIALSVFGDASLWYLIADANGLRQDSDLIVGKSLTIPNRITNLRNSYDVHKPYQAGEIIGDTTPTLPDPPPPPVDDDDGCGVLGQILVIFVTVVVSIVAPYVLGLSGWIGAAVGGAVGNIAGQAVGNLTGVQDGFDWGAVALAAVSAGATHGIGGGAEWYEVAARAAAANAVNQGLSIVTGR